MAWRRISRPRLDIIGLYQEHDLQFRLRIVDLSEARDQLPDYAGLTVERDEHRIGRQPIIEDRLHP